MTDTNIDKNNLDSSSEPRCQYFVMRKKRLCRMTVKPGKQYCGEHEPQPLTADGQDDTRIPCPNDPKHTCYASKLEKHLSICNSRPRQQPSYIVYNINSPRDKVSYHRRPLSQLSEERVLKVIQKINIVYDTHIKGNITAEEQRPIHDVVLEEFSEKDRTESSRRHLRQASSLLRLAEAEGLVADNTCYVELGAGRGRLSYYACAAWCGARAGSAALLVERAAPRHKRDNKLAGAALRLRADLAHLALARAPRVGARALVGLAKHLCGAATDYALRCITSDDVLDKCRGLVLATCCHHRCEQATFVANRHLQELGISGDELNVMLGLVSWATCGDGRSRAERAAGAERGGGAERDGGAARAGRGEVGRRAKCVLDWGRVLYLRERGFEARLCHYVPSSVSLENICIVAKKRI